MRSFLVRLAVAAVAIPALLWIMSAGAWWLRGLIAVLIIVGGIEFGTLCRSCRVEFAPPRPILLALLAALYVWPEAVWLWPAWMALAVMLCGLSSLWKTSPREALLVFASQLAGSVWLGLGFGALVALREIGPGVGYAWLILLFANLWLGDTAAYLFGMWLGKRPLAPQISPKKTVAGAVAQVCVSAAVGIGTVLIGWIDASPVLVIAASILIGIIGQAGDLIESSLKRVAGVKDSSSLIPGHGGVLDRFDSTLFAAPLLWMLITLWPLL